MRDEARENISNKFRAWDTRKNKYSLIFDLFSIDMDDSYRTWLPGLGKTYEEDVIIEQYTGYKNWFKNDIIRTDHFVDKINGQQYLYHQIVWSEKYLCWYAKNCGNKNSFSELDNGNLQLWVFIKNAINPVISGNIHEQ